MVEISPKDEVGTHTDFSKADDFGDDSRLSGEGEVNMDDGVAASGVQGVISGDGGACEVGGAMPYERVANSAGIHR